MEQPQDKGDLAAKTRNWVDAQGYPLELRAARAFRHAGFETHQSELYLDQTANLWREIDIVAHVPDYAGVVRIVFSIECKSSSKPWVLFTSQGPLGESIYDLYAVMSKEARSALAAIDESLPIVEPARLEVFDRLRWLEKDQNVAYAFRQAFSDHDPAYAALVSSSKSASHLIRPNRYLSMRTFRFAFPVILVDSPLYVCSLDEGGEVVLKPAYSGEVLFRDPDSGLVSSCIHVVTLAGLDDFIADAKREAKQLRQELKGAAATAWAAEFNTEMPLGRTDW